MKKCWITELYIKEILNNKMKVKVYFEGSKSSMGGWEIVSIFKLMWWIFIGRILPKENSAIYFIRKIETIDGRRI